MDRKEILNSIKNQIEDLTNEIGMLSGKYLFTRYSFFQMMGTKNNIEDEMEKYME